MPARDQGLTRPFRSAALRSRCRTLARRRPLRASVGIGPLEPGSRAGGSPRQGPRRDYSLALPDFRSLSSRA